jgi:hypothetical protein
VSIIFPPHFPQPPQAGQGLGLPGKQETRSAPQAKDTSSPGAGFGWVASRIDLMEVTHKDVAFTQLVFGSAKSGSAFTVPIPVLLEPTRSLYENLLTRGTVLGQPHCGKSSHARDSMRITAKTGSF